MSAAPERSDVLRGIGLMVLSMACLAMGDMFIKLAAGAMPVGQVMLGVSLGGALVFLLIVKGQGLALWHPAMRDPAFLWRNLAEAVGAIGMVLGIVLVPLSTYGAVIQMAPLIITIAAAVLLKERIGPRRWGAVAVGFVGMLLILRPGLDGFTPEALWPLLGITALSVRDVLTRMVPAGIPSLSISLWGFAATLPAGPLMLAAMGTPLVPGTSGLWFVLAATAATCAGYFAIINAMRAAPASVVAPFRYTRLIFVMALAITVFGERPDPLTLLGAAIILGAGLYTFARERALANAARAA